MRRFFAGTLVASVIALIVAACDDGGGRGGDGNGGYQDSCNQLTACVTCTPVQGCGWCTFADGTGACVADPSECDTAPTFTWTWDATGCRAGADASVVGGDAARAADGSTVTTSQDGASADSVPVDGAPGK